jgi:uncharacterized protein
MPHKPVFSMRPIMALFMRESLIMAGLRDQLLKSGLVNEKQVKKAKKEKHKEQKTQGKSVVTDEKQRLQQAQSEKTERDRLLNLQRQAEADKKALAAQARQLIESHRIERKEGETPFNFTDAGKVKKLYLEITLRDKVVRGQVAIVRLDQQYEFVPRETAEKILQRDPSVLILLNEIAGDTETSTTADPYADFQVPDDLIW